MATINIPLTANAYVLVAAADKEFLAENASSSNIRVTFASSLPAVDSTSYHVLEACEAMMRFGLVDALYARAETGTAYIVVSVS